MTVTVRVMGGCPPLTARLTQVRRHTSMLPTRAVCWEVLNGAAMRCDSWRWDNYSRVIPDLCFPRNQLHTSWGVVSRLFGCRSVVGVGLREAIGIGIDSFFSPSATLSNGGQLEAVTISLAAQRLKILLVEGMPTSAFLRHNDLGWSQEEGAPFATTRNSRHQLSFGPGLGESATREGRHPHPL